MQSDPSEVSQNTSVNLPPSTPNNPSQHGQHSLNEQGTGYLFDRQTGSQSHHHAFTAGYVSSDDVLSQDGEDPLRLRRLSSRSSGKDMSYVDRISEYENAQTPSPRKDGHLGFMVIPSSSKRNPDRSIENFPNGKLNINPLLWFIC